MRAAGRVVAAALDAARTAATAGVTLRELDEIAAAVIRDAGAKPAFLGYHPRWAPTPYPGVLCTSVNDAVVHGIPSDYALRDGDLLSVDCGAYLDNWCGDSAFSMVVGADRSADRSAVAGGPGTHSADRGPAADARASSERLIAAAEAALAAGIAAAVPGNRLGDIAAAIGTTARTGGYGILDGHGGHGIGRAMHEDPHVPNEGRAGRGLRLRPGLVLALEPMLIADGSDDYRHDPDGWTLRTYTGARAAHVEHTVAITDAGPVVLTLP